MKYTIEGGQLPVAVCELSSGEGLFTEAGGMSWMTGSMEMNTGMDGGLKKGIGRIFAGESAFIAHYKAEGGTGLIAFASSFPGSIVPIELGQGQSVIAQKSAFLAATEGVQLTTHFQRKIGAGLVGGDGFIMQRITGPGTVFLEIDGAAIEYDLKPEQVMKVDTGHVAIMDESVKLDITTVKGFKNILFGGEGLFLTTLTGPGKIWLQSMPIENMAKNLIPFMPTPKK